MADPDEAKTTVVMTVEKVTRTEAKIEVTLPAYSQHVMDGCTIYARLGPDMKRIAIWVWLNRPDRMQMDVETVTGRVASDYYLGRGEFACRKDEFDAAYDRFTRALAT